MENKFTLALVIPSLAGGGSEKIFSILANHINSNLFEITLVLVSNRNAVYLDEIPQHVKVVNLNSSRVLFALPKIILLMWKNKYNYVLSTLSHLNLAISIIIPILPKGIKFYARESSTLSRSSTKTFSKQIWKFMYTYFYPRFDKIICQSEHMQKELNTEYRIENNKLTVINNPINLGEIKEKSICTLETTYSKANNNIKLVAAGRLHHVKGFDILIEAISLLNDSKITLEILGEGPLRNTLLSKIHNLNLSEQIKLLGFIKNPYPYFARADAFILSSRYDAYPNVVLEALACGTPVIATPAVGGITDILNNFQDCIISEKIDSESLAESIKNFNFRKRIHSDKLIKYDVSTIITKYEAELLTK